MFAFSPLKWDYMPQKYIYKPQKQSLLPEIMIWLLKIAHGPHWEQFHHSEEEAHISMTDISNLQRNNLD